MEAKNEGGEGQTYRLLKNIGLPAQSMHHYIIRNPPVTVSYDKNFLPVGYAWAWIAKREPGMRPTTCVRHELIATHHRTPPWLRELN